MQRALVVLDDIFYCSVGNGLDRSSTLGPDIFVCANPQPAERSRPFPTNREGFCPLFILYKYKTKTTARLPERHIPNRRAVI